MTLRLVWVLLLLSAAVFPAFGATYHDPHGKYTLDVPQGWTATAGEDGNAVLSSGAAYVRVVNVPGGGKDIDVVKRTISQVGAQWQNFKQTSSASATLSGQRGIGVFFTGVNPKGVPAILRIVAAPFGEDAFMLIMSAPNAGFVKVQDALKQIEAGFTLGSGAKSSPKTEQADAQPERAASMGGQDSEGMGGGHMLYGEVKDAASSSAAFKAGLAHTRGVFDAPLSLGRVVQSKDGHIQMGSFTAVRGGAQMGGLAISVYDPDGLSGFAVLYDALGHLAKSLPLMMKRVNAVTQNMLESARPQGDKSGVDWASFEKNSHGINLSHTEFPDGTATIGVAPGFTPQNMSGGAFSATSADGAYVNLFVPCPILDTNSDVYRRMVAIGRNGGNGGPPQIAGQIALPYDADPVNAWKAYLTQRARQQRNPDPHPEISNRVVLEGTAPGWHGSIVTGTITWNNVPFVFTGTLLVTPAPDRNNGSWMLQVSVLAAPAAHAAEDMPALLAMKRSEKVDMQKVIDQTMRNIAAISEQTSRLLASRQATYNLESQQRFDAVMNRAAANRKVMDQSTAAFIDHIRDQSVVGVGSGKAHIRVSNNLASALEQADPQHFRVLAAKEYIPGRDY